MIYYCHLGALLVEDFDSSVLQSKNNLPRRKAK